jgi:hypothetical protein
METIEEAAEKYCLINNIPIDQMIVKNDRSCEFETPITMFIKGAKFQAQRMYSDMQEYAEFCIECDRKEMPLLLVQDWYEHYKNQNNEQ